MNRISKGTRRDIRRIFAEELSGPGAIMPYYGCLGAYAKSSGEVEFLSRLYDLHHMDARDDRSSSAYEELQTCAHLRKAVKDPTWFFEDKRFHLKNKDKDEPLLRLVAEVFHPEVRTEEMPWKTYLARFNALLRPDGYELYPADSISNRSIYRYREYSPVQFPKDLYTERYKGYINHQVDPPKDKISGNISLGDKTALMQIALDFDKPIFYRSSQYDFCPKHSSPLQKAIKNLNKIMHWFVFNPQNDAPLGAIRLAGRPALYILDLLELQYAELPENEQFKFRDAINTCLTKCHPEFSLSSRGLIIYRPPVDVLNIPEESRIQQTPEKKLRELIQRAVELHRLPEETSRKEAVEKIWDALERLKTYYVDEPKKTSAQQLIQNVSGGQEEIRALLDEEFQKLTTIGNTFFIRHSETDQIIPADVRHYDYFFNRCLSLILLAIPYLEESEAPHDGL